MSDDDIKIKFAELKSKLDNLCKEVDNLRQIKSEVFIRIGNLEKESHLRNYQFDHVKKLISEMGDDIKEIRSELKIIAEKPAKRLDLIITGIIGFLISGIGGFILSNFLHK